MSAPKVVHVSQKNGSRWFGVVAGLAITLVVGPSLLRAQPAGTQPSGSASASSSASAAPSSSSTAPASSASGSSTASSTAPTTSSTAAPSTTTAPLATAVPTAKAPGPPPPTDDQIAALAELQKEADNYEAQAKEYRSTITRIVKHHYEERKRRILSALDREITIEKKALIDAREEAIRRLEAFVARYSGPNAHPENTPDAMFRLAALYEERARADETDISDAELAARLQQAITLYKTIIQEFPKYRELAGVYYYLGHALNDSNRKEEAQQVWRSLVCSNVYTYPVPADPSDPNKDQIMALPQDHDDHYWEEWNRRHPEPIKGGGGGGKATGKPKPKTKKSVTDDLVDETSFQNPFPSTCTPIPQKVLAGAEPRYIAEVWWLIGDYHFNEISRAAGAFNYNRAQAAYTNSLQFKKPPIYGVAMYKLAWTYFKQQRYKQSVLQFIELLRYADEQEKLTGDAGADFRSEAYTYIAGSLTYLDFDGPGPDEPYIPRNDVLDTEQDPAKQEQKMHVAIDRVQDPNLIPQNEKWTVEIYKALAQEFSELNQYKNTIEVSELILKKWPLDCGAPVVQNRIAEIYDTMMRAKREGTPEYEEYAAKALEARTKLAEYVGANKPWTRACINDPEAIQTAERLVRGGLRRAAADHTNAGRALAEEGLRSGDKSERDKVFERALREYQLAAQGWEGYLVQDENSSDAYESRFWLADANHMIVVLTVALDRVPTDAQVQVARSTAVAVRDSNEDSKYLQPAAFFVVDVAYQQLQAQYKRFKVTNGSEGVEMQDGVTTVKEGEKEKVVKKTIPPAVLAVMIAREEYTQRVPEASDVMVDVDNVSVPQSKAYKYDVANYYFNYGDFDEARKRFYPMYATECGNSPFGAKAWSKLKSMAALEENIDETRKLAEAVIQKPCATTEEGKIAEQEEAVKIQKRGYYIDAAQAYEAAEKMPPGPERDAQWRKAAALYKTALEKAPSHDEAPEAAMWGANAYKQVGEYDDAIAMYELFIKEYGNEDRLKALENGDPKANPPVEKNLEKYEKRRKNLKDAYDALASAHALFFNYRAAAETNDTISRNKRFDEADRRQAAMNALILYANMGDEDKMLAARKTLGENKPSVEQTMEADFLIANSDLKDWNENGSDDGSNKSARLKAMGSMEAYYLKNRNTKEAARFNVNAAYLAAKMHRVGKDAKAVEWCQNTMKAFDTFKSSPDAAGSLEADMAAECAYRAVDEELKAKFDYDTGHHRYTGVIDKVKQQYEKDVKEANDVWFPKLQAVIDQYASAKWTVAARARQGSLYDSCRTGLYNATPPAVKLYTDAEEKALKRAEDSNDDALLEKADQIRQTRREQWRALRENELGEADRAMVKFYVEATLIAKMYKVRNEGSELAIRRLAFFTDILGNPKMREYSQVVVDPETKANFKYEDNIFLRTRPGLTSDPAADGMPSPLPVAP
ncbi:MAG: hypothetical protein U0271_18580 [Polyangiaceae bacterium]